MLVAAAAVVDIAESLFWIWFSKRRKAVLGAEALVGQTTRVVRPCRPVGFVRLGGELWQAHCADGADRGDEVRVVGFEGLTLIVERT